MGFIYLNVPLKFAIMFQLTYIHHDCFVAVADGVGSVVFDYWKDPAGENAVRPPMLDLIPKGLPCLVLVSHHHKDHFNRDIFEWADEFPLMHYVVSKDVAKMIRHMLRPDSIWKGTRVSSERITILTPGEKFQQGRFLVEAFGSTDIGNSYLVTLDGDFRMFHAGDLNAWIWKDESTEAEVDAALSGYWCKLEPLVHRFARYTVRPALDVAMFPVDSRIGSEYWTGAKIFLEAFDNTALFLPMHFGLGETPEQVEKFKRDARDFRRYCNPDSKTACVALQSRGDSLALCGKP